MIGVVTLFTSSIHIKNLKQLHKEMLSSYIKKYTDELNKLNTTIAKF
jgi:hypothetical protein